jgi:hypothetical protein
MEVIILVAILFALKLFVFAVCASVVLAVLIYVPLAIYAIPYCLWVGFQNNVGKHKDKKDEKLSRTVRNATILYKSWILRKEPTF